MNVLIACEESQTVCLAFRKKGHNAYSCDIVDCSGGYPEYHIKRDVLEVMKGGTFKTQGGQEVTIDKWDLMIAHPPCTFLSSSGASWYYHPEDKGLPVEQRRPHPDTLTGPRTGMMARNFSWNSSNLTSRRSP